MKNTFKIFAATLLTLSLFLLAGCQTKTTPTDDQDVQSTSNEQDQNISEDNSDQESKDDTSVEPKNEEESEIEEPTNEETTEPMSEKNNTTVTPPVNDEQQDSDTSNLQTKASVKSFTIVAQKWSFEPSTITVNEGDTVKLTIQSVDVDHGFKISEFGVESTLKAGETTVVEFVVSKKGTYSFFCSVYCGSGHSTMKGTLIVN